ncbi:signal peptidase I [Cellulomonas hominis]
MTDQQIPERSEDTRLDTAGETQQPAASHRASGRGDSLGWLRETAIILVSALVLSLVVKTFLVQAFFIPSGSMHDTLIEGDRVLVSKLTPGPFDLHRGDIVVFKDPGNWLTAQPAAQPSGLQRVFDDALTFVGLLPQDSGEHLIKRVIGLPGDEVASTGDGTPITVNGVAIDEPYLAPGSIPSEIVFDVVVPEGRLWVMGDNRQQSSDSRWHMGDPGGGSIPIGNVVGTAFVRVWPADRFGLLRNPRDSFAAVPDPS